MSGFILAVKKLVKQKFQYNATEFRSYLILFKNSRKSHIFYKYVN